ncbi:MAG: hypothetical protein K6G07_00435 [Lachnospiraceae bacterium]|nr:hypothetical protein [Lachnospiraceae bacterium]
METGILSDGSLSARKKGDLFWKKYKLFKQFEMDHESGANAKTDLIVNEIFQRYDDASSVSALDGNEFRVYPPTATGRDARCSAIVRAMKKRDEMRKEGDCDKELFAALCDALSSFFAVQGFDEESRKPVAGKDRSVAEQDFLDKVKAYEERFFADNGPAQNEGVQDEGEGSSVYERKRLRSADFKEFSSYIPNNYLGQLRNGTVLADAYYTGEVSPDTFFGLIIFAKHEGWKEIIWIAVKDTYATDIKANKEFLSFVLWEARRQNEYCGVFVEIHKGEYSDGMGEVLRELGMYVYMEKNNVYECHLSDVEGQKSVMAAASKIKCNALEDTDEEDMDEIEQRINRNKQPVPIAIPVPWDSYCPDLSFTYVKKNSEDAGLLMVSSVGDSYVLDLVYGSNPMIVAALIGHALNTAGASLSGEQKLLVPIVNEATRPLMVKMVPSAVRGDIAETVMWFS